MKKLKKIARFVINQVKKLDRKYRPKINQKDATRLHLGCGNIQLKGFCNVGVQEYPHEPHFLKDVTDASLAKEPFGEFLSLNVIARKARA